MNEVKLSESLDNEVARVAFQIATELHQWANKEDVEFVKEKIVKLRAVNTFDQARIALIQLRNEIVGTVGLAEAVLRNVVGNTNMVVLQEKIAQAERCIAAMNGEK